MLYLLTGEIECGKTTWLKNLIEQAARAGVSLDGLITPAVFENGNKIGIDCLLLPQGETLPFGKRADLLDGTEKTFEAALALRWIFSDDVMRLINEHLAQITPAHPSEHLMLIDELGVLELRRDQGFVEALRILEQGCYHDAIVVVRPSLLDIAQKRFASGAGGESHVQIIKPGFDYFA